MLRQASRLSNRIAERYGEVPSLKDARMKWPSWLRPPSRHRRPATSSLTACPTCGKEMTLIDKTTFTGDDMRTYRCEPCGQQYIMNFGTALWKALSDAREAEEARSGSADK